MRRVDRRDLYGRDSAVKPGGTAASASGCRVVPTLSLVAVLSSVMLVTGSGVVGAAGSGACGGTGGGSILAGSSAVGATLCSAPETAVGNL